MTQFNEVVEPIICDAYAEPTHHWVIEKGQPPVKAPGRREACYYYRPPGRSTGTVQADEIGTRIPLDGVNDIRKRVEAWRLAGRKRDVRGSIRAARRGGTSGASCPSPCSPRDGTPPP